MKPHRIKSVDTFRGFIILEMVWVHLFEWWLMEEELWLSTFTISFISRIAGPGFLFISGISITLFVRSRFNYANNTAMFNTQNVKTEYHLRALFLFLVAIGYNVGVAIQFGNPALVWTWFVVLTISLSLFMVWPLLKTSKIFRILFAVIIWVANYFLFSFLLKYQGQTNFNGIIYHILYNNLDLDPILSFFSFLIIGTVVGDTLFEINLEVIQDVRRNAFKNKLLFPTLIIGVILISLGIIHRYPLTLNIVNFSWISFSLGINLIIFSLLLAIEEFNIIKTKKKYKFLTYFSIYSLTIYLTHNALYFIFPHQLKWFYAFLVIPGTIVLIGFICKKMYNSKWRNYVSLKFQLGRLAKGIVLRFEKRKERYLNKYKLTS